MASLQAWSHFCPLKLQLEILGSISLCTKRQTSLEPARSQQLLKGGTALTPSRALNPTESSEKESLYVIF